MNNETYDFEDRKYINPTLSRDEQLSFIDNLRSTHDAGMDRIVSETHNLGTDVPSIEGGLNGATGVWQQQYVTPKLNTMVSGLRATAQAQALSEVLANYQAQLTKRYNDAYRAYTKRSQNSSNKNTTSDATGGVTVDDAIATQNKGASSKYELQSK